MAFDVSGRDVLTIEGLSPDPGEPLHPLQRSFIECGGFQCGFCTPGMILSAKALLDQAPNPTPGQVRDYLNGNICRCTGYQMIVESVLAAASEGLRR